MKFLSFSKCAALFFSFLCSFPAFSQTSTAVSGNWNTAANWSPATVPGGGTNVNVNHAMTVDVNISSTSGDYIIYSSITDAAGGTAYTLSVSGTGGNQGNFDVRANSTFEGTAIVGGNGTLTVRSGTTLIVGETTFANNCTVVIEAGATLIINGDLTNNNNSTGITINGSLIINGSFTGGNGSVVAGTGTFTTTGTITNEGSSTVFGSNNNCDNGPCSGSNLCVTNTIASNQSICSGATPATITGNALAGYTYKWQQSTTSATSGFADIGGATNQDYSPASLTASIWYRRVVTQNSPGTCVASSPAVLITVNPNLVPSVAIAANPTGSICSGTNVTFTATPTNGGTSPAYQWKLNGGNVGTNINTYSNAALVNNDIVTCVMTSNAACPSSNPATSNSLTMSVVPLNGGWLGGTSSDWNTASNWCGGVPTATSNVVISSGAANMPQLTAAGAVCNQLTINSGATLTISSLGSLSVKGNITNSGTFSNNGTITLNGSSLQTVTGSFNFNHLTLNNAAGCTFANAVNVLGILTLTSGQLNSNGNVSIDLNTGAISGTGAGTISGNVTVNKSVNTSRYHYISSALNSATFAQWDDDMPIGTGPYNLYYYDETVVSPIDVNGWTAISNTASSIATLKGYAMFFNNATSIDQTGIYSHGVAPSNVTLTNTVSSDLNVDGWNLVGNPYPSTLDWDASSGWTKTGIGNAIYFWDPVNDRYSTYVGGIGTFGASNFIPAMQGFWVRVNASGGTGTFGMNNNVRVTSQNPSIWRIASLNNDNVLKLTAGSAGYSDETIIRFRDDAENSFDDQLDGYKLKNEGNTPSFYTMLGQEEFAVNSLSDTTTDITIPLHLKVGLTGQYIINAEEIGAFDSYDITLEDDILGSTQDLRAVPAYTFQVNPGDTTGRFFIKFKKSAVNGINNQQASSKVSIRSSESTVYFNFNNVSSSNGDIAVYNLLGRPISEIKNANIGSGQYSLNFPGETGIYIVRVTIQGETFTQKVCLK